MFKWIKKLVNKSDNSNNDLNDKGLQSDLNDLYIVYDKVINDKTFGWVDDYRHLEAYRIKGIISDTIKLTSNHPELLLHLGKLNESVFQLKMATTALLDIYDNKDNLAKDVYRQQKNDAKDVINKLVQRIADINKTLSGMYQDDNSSTISFLKKQMGITVDNPQEEYEKFYDWLVVEQYPRLNPVIKYLLLGAKKGYYSADTLESALSNNPTIDDLKKMVDYLLATDSDNELRIKLRDKDYDEIVNF